MDNRTRDPDLLGAALDTARAQLAAAHDAFKAVCFKDGHDWRKYVVLIRDSMPPFPHEKSDCAKLEVYDPVTNTFLRFVDSPIWDIYGEDYETEDRALAAIAKAPPPQRPYIEIRIQMEDR